jgi:hypothetical protein
MRNYFVGNPIRMFQKKEAYLMVVPATRFVNMFHDGANNSSMDTADQEGTNVAILYFLIKITHK